MNNVEAIYIKQKTEEVRSQLNQVLNDLDVLKGKMEKAKASTRQIESFLLERRVTQLEGGTSG
jgi:hypothetical protein